MPLQLSGSQNLNAKPRKTKPHKTWRGPVFRVGGRPASCEGGPNVSRCHRRSEGRSRVRAPVNKPRGLYDTGARIARTAHPSLAVPGARIGASVVSATGPGPAPVAIGHSLWPTGQLSYKPRAWTFLRSFCDTTPQEGELRGPSRRGPSNRGVATRADRGGGVAGANPRGAGRRGARARPSQALFRLLTGSKWHARAEG